MAGMPMASVMRLIWSRLAARDEVISTSVVPPPGTPRMCFSWLAAISRPEAVMKPEITGWDRRLARKPRRNRPMTMRMSPERKASAMAAPRYSAVPCAVSSPTAEAVISDTTATGPTASARLVPKMA